MTSMPENGKPKKKTQKKQAAGNPGAFFEPSQKKSKKAIKFPQKLSPPKEIAHIKAGPRKRNKKGAKKNGKN